MLCVLGDAPGPATMPPDGDAGASGTEGDTAGDTAIEGPSPGALAGMLSANPALLAAVEMTAEGAGPTTLAS